MRWLPVLAFLAIALLPLGLAQQGTSGQGRSEDYTLRPGQENHPNPVALAAGDAIVYDWAVIDPPEAQLFFSTHLHVGAQQVNITDETGPSEEGRLVADREGLYSILWKNTEDETLRYRYEYRTERVPAPNGTPVPALAGLAALAGAAVLARRRG